MSLSAFARLPTTIFEEMSALAREYGAVNLGQGFPDDPGPLALRQAAAKEVLEGYNQYPPMAGLPDLRQAVAAHYRQQSLELDWETEVAVTSGATEAIASALLGLVMPGDEVIILQPAYDAYAPLIRRCGGEPRYVTLQPPEWRVTYEALEAACGPATRFIVINNPVNPTGRVLDADELEAIARLCRHHDLVAISDEVWEEVVFTPARHVCLMSLEGMRSRTVKIGSAGKMFGLTGWKVGFACAAPELMRTVLRAHQFLTFTTPPNLQAAVASGLREPGDWFRSMPADLAARQDRFASALEAEGFRVLRSQATYFLNLDLPASGVHLDDRAFCRLAVCEAGVAAIPLSAFYEESPATGVARLCFAKSPAVLEAGVAALSRARRLSLQR